MIAMWASFVKIMQPRLLKITEFCLNKAKNVTLKKCKQCGMVVNGWIFFFNETGMVDNEKLLNLGMVIGSSFYYFDNFGYALEFSKMLF